MKTIKTSSYIKLAQSAPRETEMCPECGGDMSVDEMSGGTLDQYHGQSLTDPELRKCNVCGYTEAFGEPEGWETQSHGKFWSQEQGVSYPTTLSCPQCNKSPLSVGDGDAYCEDCNEVFPLERVRHGNPPSGQNQISVNPMQPPAI